MKKVTNLYDVAQYAACKVRFVAQKKRDLGFTRQK